MSRSPYDPTPDFHPEPWENQAACTSEDPEMFFREDRDSTDKAKTVCASCPVTSECLMKGMVEGYGIFGGLTADDRRLLRTAKTAAAIAGRRTAIKQLHAQGFNDREIGDALGITRQTVQGLRSGLGLLANSHARA